MATQIGPKIGVDGEAEYRQQMARINSEAKALKAEMRELKTEVTDEANAQENATKKAENLSNQINNQKTRVELLTQQLDKATEAYGEGSTQANTYRERLANAKVVLNQLQQEQANATTEVNEFAEAEEDAGNNAITMGDLISANLISQAIMTGLGALADLARDAADALWGTVTAGAEYADTYLTMATVTGISTDKLQEYAYMAELVDVSLDTMTGSMTKLTRQMSAARGGNETAGEAFSRLGIRITNADGALRDSTEVFFEVIEALGQMEEGSERDALAMEVFGKSAQELNPLIAAGRKGIEGFAEEARRMGYVLDEETLNKLGSLDDSFQRFTNLRTMISNRLGAGMAPAVERVVDKLIELGERVDWEHFGEALGGMLGSLADLVIALADSGVIDALLNKLNSWLSMKAFGYAAKSGYMSPEEQAEQEAARRRELASAALEYAQISARLAKAETDPTFYANSTLGATAALANDQARLNALVSEYGELLTQLTDADLQGLAAVSSNAENWGEDMMESLSKGITGGAATYLEPAVSAAATLISRYLHHSEPDVGPLANDSTWMPDMMAGWAKQINDYSPLVRDAMAGLAFDLQDVLRPGLQAGSGGVNYGGVSVVIYGADGQSASELYEEFSYRLNQDVLDREAVFA
ncbi:MAG: hypothetical protein IJI06_09885 [Oscillospiraceae bacterium]|nr:hypothetical protein [Oscillospiraceae bacterium]